jgi:hypothetical protein
MEDVEKKLPSSSRQSIANPLSSPAVDFGVPPDGGVNSSGSELRVANQSTTLLRFTDGPVGLRYSPLLLLPAVEIYTGRW